MSKVKPSKHQTSTGPSRNAGAGRAKQSKPWTGRVAMIALLAFVAVPIAVVLLWPRGSRRQSDGSEQQSGNLNLSSGSGYAPSDLLLHTPVTESNLDRLAAEKRNEGKSAFWNAKANDLLKAGQVKEAIQAYKQAIALAPKDEDLHFNLGIAYAKSGDLTNAENEYIEALKLLPDYPEAHNNLGNVLMREGRLPEAEQHFEEAIKSMPEYAQAQNNMGIVRQHQNRTNEAVEFFEKAAQADTNYWEAHLNLASAYIRMNQKDKAIAELGETLRINPSFEPAKRMLAKATGQTNTPPK